MLLLDWCLFIDIEDNLIPIELLDEFASFDFWDESLFKHFFAKSKDIVYYNKIINWLLKLKTCLNSNLISL